ncbi:MAG TPA: sulfite exporter TauE/SafE family protein [Sphingobium sp.]
MTAAITFGGGFLLGFASSLHCVGMCGGIALLFGLPQGQGRAASALAAQLPLHAGRALSYMLLGGLAGGLGAAAIGTVSFTGAHLLMRWAAAMSLAWVGLSTMGLMPSPALIGHALMPRLTVSRGIMLAPAMTGRLAAGMGWGMMPCGMVYGALLFAAFAGSALGGAAVMGGFALGTVPALLLVQSGSSTLARLARRPQLRVLVGAALVVLAAASMLSDEASLMRLCRSIGLPV